MRKPCRIAASIKFTNLALVIAVVAATPAFAQRVVGRLVSFGIAGGASPTDVFSDQTVMGVDVDTHLFSPSKDYIVGQETEVHLPLRLSVEFDALYRPLNLTIVNTIIPGRTVTIPSSVHSWEFPLLAKYRLPAHAVKPFLEAGPSFRRTQLFPTTPLIWPARALRPELAWKSDGGPSESRLNFAIRAGARIRMRIFPRLTRNRMSTRRSCWLACRSKPERRSQHRSGGPGGQHESPAATSHSAPARESSSSDPR